MLLILGSILIMLIPAAKLAASDDVPEFIVITGREATSTSGEPSISFAVLWRPSTVQPLPYGGPSTALSTVPREENQHRIQVLRGSTIACSFTVGPVESPGAATFHGKQYLSVHGVLLPSAAPCHLPRGTYRLRATFHSAVSLPSAEFTVGAPSH